MKKNNSMQISEIFIKTGFLLVILSLILISSCNDEDQSIEIKGKVVLNTNDQRVVLRLLKVSEDRQEAVDSVIISGENHNYNFNVENEGIYSLVVSAGSPGKTFVILQKGSHVQLDIDLKENKTEFIDDGSGKFRTVHSELYQLIENDNKKLYQYLKLSAEDRLSSDLLTEFQKKQRTALEETNKQSDLLLKQLEVFKYVNYTYFLGTMNYYNDREPLQPTDLMKAEKIFKIIPADSFFWSYNAQLPLLLLSNYQFPFTLSGFSNSLKKNKELLDKVITDQKDAGVAGYTAVFTMYSFTLSDEKDEVKKYVDLYYKRDTLGYSEEIRSMFNNFFSPQRKIRAGEQLPDFRISSLKDSTVVYTNKSFKGVYLIDFWATWCKPCMKEIPLHHEVYQKYHTSKQFEILSISFDRSPEIVEKFRKTKWRMPWEHAILPAGKKDPLAIRMSASFLPQMILVDGKTNTVIAEMIRLKEGNLEKVLKDYYNK